VNLHLEDGTSVEVEDVKSLREYAEKQQLIIFVVAQDTTVAENFIIYALGTDWPFARAVKCLDSVYGYDSDGACAVLLDSTLPKSKNDAVAALRQCGVPFLAMGPLAHGMVAPCLYAGEEITA
jgi:hypothetical protein